MVPSTDLVAGACGLGPWDGTHEWDPRQVESDSWNPGQPTLGTTPCRASVWSLSDSGELRAAIVLFASLLDERQRRLYAGLESLKCGWGGDTRIAALLGIDAGTVARGRQQLLSGEVERHRVRRPGGGRHAVEKKRPR